MIFTVQTSLRGVWDASYLSFITAVFAVFLAFWHIVRVNLEVKNLHIIIAAFAWIAATCLFGIFALRVNQDQEKARLVSVINSDLERASARIVSSFENQAALLVGFAADPTLREAIIEKNSSLLANRAKDLYEKTNLSRAVAFYDSEGRSVAVYPHQSIVLGTDFSDREYFQKTKASYKGFISNVFTNILGESTMVQTEPVFYNNQFSGMIGVSMSLNTLSDRFVEEFSEGASLRAVDENGAIVLASDREMVGKMSDREELGGLITGSERTWVYQAIRDPDWEIFVGTPAVLSIKNSTNLSIMVTALMFINAVFSVGVGLLFSIKNGFRGLGINPLLTVRKPAHSL